MSKVSTITAIKATAIPQFGFGKHYDLTAAAQDELEAAGGLLRAAASAMKVGKFSETRHGARKIVEAAQQSLHRALDHLIEVGYGDPPTRDIGGIDRDIYKVFGVLSVIGVALNSETAPESDTAERPVAGALDLVADTVGEDCDAGLCERAEELLTTIREA